MYTYYIIINLIIKRQIWILVSLKLYDCIINIVKMVIASKLQLKHRLLRPDLRVWLIRPWLATKHQKTRKQREGYNLRANFDWISCR